MANDLVNRIFGKLTVIKPAAKKAYDLDISSENDEEKNIQKVLYYDCRCNCGNIITVREDLLLKNLYLSCGCEIIDNKKFLIDLFTKEHVFFQENYRCIGLNKAFHFAIFDNNNNLLGVIDYRSPAYLTRIGNEDKNRVKQRQEISTSKSDYCQANNIKYLVLSVPGDTDLPNNLAWDDIKAKIIDAFDIDVNTQWYKEGSNS